MSELTHNPGREALLRTLQQAKVSYVVIGGATLEAHNQPHRTDDIDIVPPQAHDRTRRAPRRHDRSLARVGTQIS